MTITYDWWRMGPNPENDNDDIFTYMNDNNDIYIYMNINIYYKCQYRKKYYMKFKNMYERFLLSERINRWANYLWAFLHISVFTVWPLCSLIWITNISISIKHNLNLKGTEPWRSYVRNKLILYTVTPFLLRHESFWQIKHYDSTLNLLTSSK